MAKAERKPRRNIQYKDIGNPPPPSPHSFHQLTPPPPTSQRRLAQRQPRVSRGRRPQDHDLQASQVASGRDAGQAQGRKVRVRRRGGGGGSGRRRGRAAKRPQHQQQQEAKVHHQRDQRLLVAEPHVDGRRGPELAARDGDEGGGAAWAGWGRGYDGVNGWWDCSYLFLFVSECIS